MKSMIVLLIIGIGFNVLMYVIAADNFEGVVVDKAYESSLKYDVEKKQNDTVKDIIADVKTNSNNGITSIDFKIDNTKSDYDNIDVEYVVLSKPIGSDIMLEKSDKGYETSEKLENGWYKLNVTVKANDLRMVTSKSLYIEM